MSFQTPSAEELQRVKKVKARLVAAVSKISSKISDTSILRFLRAAKGNLDLAHTKLVAFNTWRLENSVDSLLERLHDRFDQLIDTGFCFFPGNDFNDRPVVYLLARIHNMFNRFDSLEKMNQLIIYGLEELIANAKPEEEMFTIVFDLTGFKMTCMDYELVRALINLLKLYYPNTLCNGYLVNAPYIFTACWSVIKPWLGSLATRISFISRAELCKYVEESLVFPGTFYDKRTRQNSRKVSTEFSNPPFQLSLGSDPLNKLLNANSSGSEGEEEEDGDDDDEEDDEKERFRERKAEQLDFSPLSVDDEARDRSTITASKSNSAFPGFGVKLSFLSILLTKITKALGKDYLQTATMRNVLEDYIIPVTKKKRANKRLKTRGCSYVDYLKNYKSPFLVGFADIYLTYHESSNFVDSVLAIYQHYAGAAVTQQFSVDDVIIWMDLLSINHHQKKRTYQPWSHHWIIVDLPRVMKQFPKVMILLADPRNPFLPFQEHRQLWEIYCSCSDRLALDDTKGAPARSTSAVDSKIDIIITSQTLHALYQTVLQTYNKQQSNEAGRKPLQFYFEEVVSKLLVKPSGSGAHLSEESLLIHVLFQGSIQRFSSHLGKMLTDWFLRQCLQSIHQIQYPLSVLTLQSDEVTDGEEDEEVPRITTDVKSELNQFVREGELVDSGAFDFTEFTELQLKADLLYLLGCVGLEQAAEVIRCDSECNEWTSHIYEKVHQLFEECWTIRTHLLGKQNPLTLAAMNQFMQTSNKQKKPQEAQPNVNIIQSEDEVSIEEISDSSQKEAAPHWLVGLLTSYWLSLCCIAVLFVALHKWAK